MCGIASMSERWLLFVGFWVSLGCEIVLMSLKLV